MRANRIRLWLNGIGVLVLLLAAAWLTMRAHPEWMPGREQSAPNATSSSVSVGTPAPTGTSSSVSVSTPTPSAPATATPPVAAPGEAARVLAGIVVAPAGPAKGYRREAFGPPYSDALSTTLPSARNGCDQRNDIRRRDGIGVRLRGRSGCVVLTAQVPDPYTGVLRPLADTELEHVVSLKNAWVSGARTMTAQQRADIAGDPLNLLLVGAAINASKGEKSAATWLPPNEAYRCGYVARQLAVKARYRLSVTPAEKERMASVLAGCPAQTLPTAAEVAPPPLGQARHPG